LPLYRAIIIGPNGNYNNAFTLLRGAYDLQVQGAFFQCLSLISLRKLRLPNEAKPEVKEIFYEISDYLNAVPGEAEVQDLTNDIEESAYS